MTRQAGIVVLVLTSVGVAIESIERYRAGQR